MVLVACSRAPEAQKPVAHARLPPGIAAQVGADAIAVETVVRIARAEHVPPSVARDRAVSDALFAAAARSAFAARSLVPVAERAAWARALLESLKGQALARGPASDAEVLELTAARWQELDRPETVRTTHAVALANNPADEVRARAVAEHIRDAVRGITDPQEFIRLAQAVAHPGVEVRAEKLPALTVDGRPYFPDNPPPDAASQPFDVDFAKAAHALAVGQIGEPVKTRFGYHVILCEARLPAQRVPLEQRRLALQDEVIKARAERTKQELLARLSRASPIPISRAADALTAQVQVTE